MPQILEVAIQEIEWAFSDEEEFKDNNHKDSISGQRESCVAHEEIDNSFSFKTIMYEINDRILYTWENPAFSKEAIAEAVWIPLSTKAAAIVDYYLPSWPNKDSSALPIRQWLEMPYLHQFSSQVAPLDTLDYQIVGWDMRQVAAHKFQRTEGK